MACQNLEMLKLEQSLIYFVTPRMQIAIFICPSKFLVQLCQFLNYGRKNPPGTGTVALPLLTWEVADNAGISYL